MIITFFSYSILFIPYSLVVFDEYIHTYLTGPTPTNTVNARLNNVLHLII